jgi:hypothetical protein
MDAGRDCEPREVQRQHFEATYLKASPRSVTLGDRINIGENRCVGMRGAAD